ncbi:MAG: hypothetical protein GX616_10915 [Planctomycetes bacterium]|nr:hypothetical protein [Planctomycetota bacterium]
MRTYLSAPSGLSGVIVAAFLLAVVPAVAAQDGSDHWCELHGEGKDGLCGRALLAEAYFEQLGRLPEAAGEATEGVEDTDITHCLLDIEVNPVTEIVSGSNTLSITSRIDGLTAITLDLRDNMTVSNVTIGGASMGFTRPGHQVTITLDRSYNTGESFQVKIDYSGTPQNLSWGSFDFGQHAGTAVVASLSEPWYAHTWWPCKEDIHDKFTMDTWVTVPNWMIVASNGALQGTDTLTGSRKRFRWRESYPISVYLVSVAMTNYTKWTEWYNHAGGSMPVEFYIYPEELASVQPLLVDVVTMIETLSAPTTFGEYPFINEKYGIAQFEWCCGMEHQTITSQGSFPERRTVHELAHSWWGNNLTCKSWHDIWLNEGFARYAEALWYERRPGGSYAAYLQHLQEYRPSSNGQYGTVYRYDISTPDLIFSSTYSYNKGAWVLHMLRHVLGDTTFFNVLASYRQMYTGGAADTDEFAAVVAAVSGRPIDWFFNQWVYANGAPYYRFGWETEQIGTQHWARVCVEQYQTSYPNFKMPIDITVTGGGTPVTHVVEQQADTQWYLLPASGAVTRVQFDKDTWILRGAGTAVSYIEGPPKLLATSPAPGTVFDPAPEITAIELWFSEPISYTAGDFSVTGSVSGPQAFSVNWDAASYKITLSLAAPLAADQVWTVQVAGTLTSSAGAKALDGELVSGFPSGDGVPGGNAVFSFTLGQSPPPCSDPFADADGDGDVDQADFGAFQRCLTGDGDPQETFDGVGCRCFDHDDDWDVDEIELSLMLACMSGPGIMADEACDDQWTLLADEFDAGTSAGNWTVFASSADYTADFAFDYSTRGIPSAPNSTGGTTIGLHLTVNNNDSTPETAAVSLFPSGRTFSGNYTLAFDMWMNYAGTGNGVGTTEMMNAGINAADTQVIWPSNPGNGVFMAVTGDGDDTIDYRCDVGSTLLAPSSGAYAAGTQSTARDNTDPYYQSLFPSPPFETQGSPGKQWVRVEIAQNAGTVTWKLNGTPIVNLTGAAYTAGNVMLGYMDLFSSISVPPEDTFIIYDNVTVTASAP